MSVNLSAPSVDNLDQIPFVDLASQKKRLKQGIMASIDRVVEHGHYIMGPEIDRLEGMLCQMTGARYALTCSSGTDALMLGLLAKGVKKADAIFVPAFSYFSTAESVALLGANPVFVDVDPHTFNMDPQSLREAIMKIKSTDLKPAGVLAVDLFGQPADYAALRAVADDYNLWLMGDASQSFGASRHGHAVGQLTDISCTSFSPAKPLGCYGEGGAIFLQDEELFERVSSCRNHGQGSGREDAVRLGFNGHLASIQAAILLEKLTLFDEEMASRRRVADRYTQGLQDVCQTPHVDEHNLPSWSQYTIRLKNRDEVAADLALKHIPTRVYYHKPLNEQPAYRRFPMAPNGVNVSRQLSLEVMSLPIHAYLSEATQDHIIENIRQAIDRNS
jgi:dTDP-4-amino-4,6-dideoxygalactose transaminase